MKVKVMNKHAVRWIIHKNKGYLPLLGVLTLVSILFSSTGVLFALASKQVIDSAISDSSTFVVDMIYLGIVLVSMLVLRALFQYLNIYLMGKVELSMKKEMFIDVLNKEFLPISGYHSGDLLNRFNSDISKIAEGFVDIVPKLTYFIVRFTSAFVVLFIIDQYFALIILGFGLLVLLGSKLFGGTLRKAHLEHQESETSSRSFVQETFANMLVIKSFDAYVEVGKQNEALLQDHLKKKIKRNNLSIFASSGLTSVLSVGYFIALIWGALQIVADQLSFGSLTAILQLVQQVQSPFSGLSQLMPKYYGMIASAERIMEVEDIKNEKNIEDIQVKVEDFKQLIFDSVTFGYEPDKPILKNLSIAIPANEIIRLSGISGTGKSTILKLMLGLMEPNSGSISIELKNGKKIKVSRSTRKLFTYVPQGNLILSGTVRDNIVFGKEDYDMNQVVAAAKAAELDSFIKTLPDKYDTILGERGYGLSEGQIQRLAIARGIMRDGFFMLFDEATSALDHDTEIKILNNIKKLRNRTCVLVSHKDNVSVISEKIIEIKDDEVGDAS